MTLTSRVVAVARMVRAVTLGLALSMMLGFVAVQAFSSQYGDQGVTTVLIDSRSDDTMLTAAIARQESAGLRCSESPTLTDVILFQREQGAEVTVMTFDEAITASASRLGWIRRYCV